MEEIHEQDKLSQDPKFLHNLKMACLRDDWVLFNDSLIQVHISYRIEGMIKVNIGNKNSLDVKKFGVIEDGNVIV